MRKLICIAWVMITMAIGLQAADQDTLRFSIDTGMEMFRLEQVVPGRTRVISESPDYQVMPGSSGPYLPVRRISVLVPPGAELVTFDFSCEEEAVSGNIRMERAPDAVPLNRPPMLAPDAGEYNGSGPDSVLVYVDRFIQKGFTWLSFLYSPFRYENESGTLYLNGNLQVQVSYRSGKTAAPVVRPDDLVVNMLRDQVVNPADLDRRYLPHGISDDIRKSAPQPVDYLIISSDELKPAFQPLLEWKIRKGLEAKIVTLEEIRNTYEGSTMQLKIKKCLYDYYLNHGLTWALLGGDSDVVPVQGCYGNIQNGDYGLEDNTIPTDLFYACFDNRFDWNSLVDDKIGQVYRDGHDISPEIYLTRVPVKTPEQTELFVKKILHYEMEPPETGFFDRILLSGVRSWTTWDGKSDNHHRSETLFDRYIARHFKGNKFMFFDTGTDFPGGSSYEVSAPNLVDQLNSGFSFFLFSGHGDTDFMAMEEGFFFNSEDAMSLRNPVSGIVLSNTCYVAAFDSIDPSISEAFLRNPDGGGVGFFGSSRLAFGLAAETSELGPSFQFNARFAKYLFGDYPEISWKSFGGVATLAKSDFINNGSTGGIYLYLLYAINPMGDPEMPVYSKDPDIFGNVRIFRMGNALSVNTGGVSNARICVTGEDLGYRQMAENVSYSTFENVPASFRVTITAPGYKPYQYISGPATGMHQDRLSNIRVFPNPTRGVLNIDPGYHMATAVLSDVTGKQLAEYELSPGSQSVDVSHLPDGVYLLRFLSGTDMESVKIIKQSSQYP